MEKKLCIDCVNCLSYITLSGAHESVCIFNKNLCLLAIIRCSHFKAKPKDKKQPLKYKPPQKEFLKKKGQNKPKGEGEPEKRQTITGAEVRQADDRARRLGF